MWLHHVSIPRPPGSAAQTRAFYGDLLGLEELPVPASIAHLDVIWFRLGAGELHLFSAAQLPTDDGRHFCIVVRDLSAVRQRLTQAGYQPWDAIPIPGRPRFFCRDPFGNQIEFTALPTEEMG
ncbi:VOC family protein [Kallotenue papyrolyticum]|uniref:VOC family protein n=1 Tax=Kallotenue papyrolyticum TaxID=1325125 RepID=UPI000470C0F5|nr:VOC family protein [Kallotenue papyrolyticum]